MESCKAKRACNEGIALWLKMAPKAVELSQTVPSKALCNPAAIIAKIRRSARIESDVAWLAD